MMYIITADMHLMSRQPKCRADDYHEAQVKMLEQLNAWQQEHQAKVIHAGDMFDKWDDYRAALMFDGKMPKGMITIQGNHDVPNNNSEYRWSAWALMMKVTGMVNVPSFSTFNKASGIAMLHKLVFENEPPPYLHEADTARKVITSAQQAYGDAVKLVVTGDNHSTFTHEHNGVLLINPGSPMRFNASQKNHKPCVFLYDGTKAEPLYFDISKDIIDDTYLERQKEVASQFETFIDIADGNDNVAIDYDKNLDMALAQAPSEVVKYIKRKRKELKCPLPKQSNKP